MRLGRYGIPKPPRPNPLSSGVGHGPVRFLAQSVDRKLSPVTIEACAPRTARDGSVYAHGRPVAGGPFCAATYASIAATCPKTCKFKDAGCYVETGFTRIASRLMNKAARRMTGDEVMKAEADLINRFQRAGIEDERDLRLHVGGDVSSEAGARILAAAAARWRARGGGAVWTFTHRWREIPREAFGEISVLASVDDPSEAGAAIARGYAPAITVPFFGSPRRFELAGHRYIPCPSEAGKNTCVECRLCLDRDLLRMGVGIAFALHGGAWRKPRRSLSVLKASA